jgi:predicted metal-dependent hydrolase/DNA-directed RNA polymerase subunit RPC12/RpoP
VIYVVKKQFIYRDILFVLMVTNPASLHPKAIEGMKLFNEQKFFEAHEELETAWRTEQDNIRELYRGILQVAVCYLHITRGNYAGAVKVYERSMKWLNLFPDVHHGIQVKKLRYDAERVMSALQSLGAERIREFDASLFKPVVWDEKRIWICDRCGTEMYEQNCKVSCPNCGNRFDCSDLNIYFD